MDVLKGSTLVFDDLVDKAEIAVTKTSSVALREALAGSFLKRLEVWTDDEGKRHFQPSARVVIFSDTSPRTQKLAEGMMTFGMVPLVITSGYDHTITGDLTFNHFAQYCILDAEHVAKTSDLFLFCADLRDKNPEVPIILTSTAFDSDDLTQERYGLCDASLAGKFTLASLHRVISAAASNNLARRLSLNLNA